MRSYSTVPEEPRNREKVCTFDSTSLSFVNCEQTRQEGGWQTYGNRGNNLKKKGAETFLNRNFPGGWLISKFRTENYLECECLQAAELYEYDRNLVVETHALRLTIQSSGAE